MEIFSLVCNEASALTSLLKHTTVDVQWTITFGSGSTLNPLVHWYWYKEILSKTVLIISQSLIWLRLSPQGQTLACLLLLHMMNSVRNTKPAFSEPPSATQKKKKKCSRVSLMLGLVLIFDPDQIKWTGEKWSFCSPAGEWDVKTLIHLGFRTTVSNYSHGNLVKAMVFQGCRETTFCRNYALHESYSLCGLAAIKTERMPFLSQKPWASVPLLYQKG